MKTFDELILELSERKLMSQFDRKKIGMRMSRMMKSPAMQAKIARARLKKYLVMQKFNRGQTKQQNKLL